MRLLALTSCSNIKAPGHGGNAATAVGELANEPATYVVEPGLIMVAKQTEVQPDTHSPALVHSKRSGLKIVEPVPFGATRARRRGEMLTSHPVSNFAYY